MSTVRHPRFPDVTREVPRKDVARWVASGWVDVDPPKKHRKPKPPQESAGDE